MNLRNDMIKTLRSTALRSTLLLAFLLLNACSSVQSDEGAEGAPPPAADAPVAATNAVPNDAPATDDNPELALAVTGGATIVDPGTPSAATGQPPTTSPVPDPNAVPSSDPGAAQAAANMAPAAPDAQAQADTANTSLNTNNSNMKTASSGKSHSVRKGHEYSSHGASRSVASVEPTGPGYNYTVKQGDTLMKIAYEQYGDIYAWKKIYHHNQGVIQDPQHVPPGTVLTLNGGGRNPASAHEGEQYMIQTGDTLGKISSNVYGTFDKWKKIWDNNKDLIKDPNRIYAGFYLYYLPEGKGKGKVSMIEQTQSSEDAVDES